MGSTAARWTKWVGYSRIAAVLVGTVVEHVIPLARRQQLVMEGGSQ